MATPVKTVSSLFLTSARHISSESPKLLSPGKNKICVSPISLENKVLINYPKIPKKCNINSSESIKIKITNENNISETLPNAFPHKSQLCSFGSSECDLLCLIGRGSFGTVIKGDYKGKVVAIKVVKVSSTQLNERNALHLVHTNVIRTLDVVVNRDQCLVMMEFYKNSKNLQTFLDDSDSALTRSAVLKYSGNIASGLKYCHENDVLHLDIKPKNILLCDDMCKICDFGNSVRASACPEAFEFRGTVAYAAPEILKGKKPSAKSDVYSLGILIWQLMTRKCPYELLDSEVVIYKVVKFNFRPLLSEEDEKVSDLCRLCWKSNPSERPSSADICEMLTVI